jgi:hypothetical protein
MSEGNANISLYLVTTFSSSAYSTTSSVFIARPAASAAQLGDAAFEATWAEGQRMTLGQAIEEALMV